jgi:hypothetical protein
MMRQVLMGDIIAAARSLRNVPPPMQAAAANALFYRAHLADKVMKRTGMPHSAWGNGSLLACAALPPPIPEPFPSDLEYLVALQAVIEGLIAWKKAQAALNSSCAAMDLCARSRL